MHRSLTVRPVQRLLSLGRSADAQALAHRQLLQLPASDSPLAADVDGALERVLALQLQVAGEARAALERSEALLRQAALAGHLREQVHLHLLAAEIHVQAGQLRQAARAFSLAVAVAARPQLLQAFLDREPLVQHLLAHLTDRDLGLTRQEDIALVARLRGAAPRLAPVSITVRNVHPAASPASKVPNPVSLAKTPGAALPAGPVELLTARELQLLELLDQGLSNQQIADQAALSLPTVKWHFYNMYGKLQVKSRSAALARARALQLLHR